MTDLLHDIAYVGWVIFGLIVVFAVMLLVFILTLGVVEMKKVDNAHDDLLSDMEEDE